jgi:streptogramin lyase
MVRRISIELAVLVSLTAGCSVPMSVTPGGAFVATGPDKGPSGVAIAVSEPVAITEFNLPVGSYEPYFAACIAAGPDGAMWVAEDADPSLGTSAIVRMETNGRVTALYGYSNSAFPSFLDVVTGPDRALWLTDFGDGLIVQATTTGTIVPYHLDNNGQPEGITVGPDQALWFTETTSFGPAIGRITTSGAITIYTMGISPRVYLSDITAGPDGALWFTEANGDRIGRITTDGAVREYAKGISRFSRPWSITAGPDGALWFTESSGRRIGRITTSGSVTEYSVGISGHEHPIDIAAGPDGALWFTETSHAQIGRITTSGRITEYAKGVTQGSRPTCIVRGPDGNMWFSQYAANLTGRVNL